MPVIKTDQETIQGRFSAGGNFGNEFLWCFTGLFSGNHDRGTVHIVSADEMDFPLFPVILLHSLETDPDVGLDIFHDVSDMKRCVGVRQGSSDKQLS